MSDTMTSKDWQLNRPMTEVVAGDIVDTGDRIRRVESITIEPDRITLHIKEGPPYVAGPDNLIDIFRDAHIG